MEGLTCLIKLTKPKTLKNGYRCRQPGEKVLWRLEGLAIYLVLTPSQPGLQPLICQISLAADSKSDMVSFAADSSLISGGQEEERKPGHFQTVLVINQTYTAMESYHVIFLLLYFYLSVILHI